MRDRLLLLLVFSSLMVFFNACQKSFISAKYLTSESILSHNYAHNSNNLYFPNFFTDLPMDLLKQFRPSSAMQQHLQITGNILIVPTKDGKIEAYDLSALKRIGSMKMKPKIRSNVVPINNHLLIAKEYGKHSLFLYEPVEKKNLWTADLGSIKALAKVEGDRLLVATLYGGLYCLKLHSGERLWQFNPLDQLHTSPLIMNNTVFQISEKGTLFAVNMMNGSVLWERELSYAGLINPILVNDHIICCTTSGQVFCVSADGKKIWEYHCNTQIRRNPGATMDQVFIADQNGVIHALRYADGTLIWKYESNTIYGTNPFITNQYVILGTLDHRLIFLDLISGDPLWELELFGRVRTDPIVWGDRLIIGSENNYLYVLANEKEITKR